MNRVIVIMYKYETTTVFSGAVIVRPIRVFKIVTRQTSMHISIENNRIHLVVQKDRSLILVMQL